MAPRSDDSSERRSCLQAPMPMLKLTQPGPGRTWPKEMLHHHSKYVLLSSVHWCGCVVSWLVAALFHPHHRFNAWPLQSFDPSPGTSYSRQSSKQRCSCCKQWTENRAIISQKQKFQNSVVGSKTSLAALKKPAIVKSFPAPSKRNIGTWKSHLWKKTLGTKSWTPIFLVPTCWIFRAWTKKRGCHFQGNCRDRVPVEAARVDPFEVVGT